MAASKALKVKPLSRRRGHLLSFWITLEQNTASMGLLQDRSSCLVDSKAGCNTAELAGVTWACRWRCRSNVCDCLLCCTSILNIPSPVSTAMGDLLSTKRQSTTRELSSAFWRFYLRSLWSGALGTVGIRGTNSRMRLPSRPLMTLR